MHLSSLHRAPTSVLTVASTTCVYLSRWKAPSRNRKSYVESAARAKQRYRRRLSSSVATAASDGDGETTSDSILFDSLAAAFALPGTVAVTSGISSSGTGARGLVTTRRVAPGETILAVDRAAALVVADEGIDDGEREDSTPSFASEALDEFQMLHGELPPELDRFLRSGDVGWFPRLCALFLWATAADDGPSKRRAGGAFGAYAALLPDARRELGLLLNFDEREAELLLPRELREVAEGEREALRRSVHDRWFSGPSRSSASVEGGSVSARPSTRAPEFSLAFLAPRGFESTLAAASLVNSRCFAELAPMPGGADEGTTTKTAAKTETETKTERPRRRPQALSLVVPLCDFANHASAPSATFRLSPNSSSFELVATRAMHPGEEVTISYLGGSGNATGFRAARPEAPSPPSPSPMLKDSTGMLRAYGFVPPGNAADRLRSLEVAGEEMSAAMVGRRSSPGARAASEAVALAAEALSSRTRDAAERRRISAAALSIAEGASAFAGSYGTEAKSSSSSAPSSSSPVHSLLENLASRVESEANEAREAAARALELGGISSSSTSNPLPSAIVAPARAEAAASWWRERSELARCGAGLLREMAAAEGAKR